MIRSLVVGALVCALSAGAVAAPPPQAQTSDAAYALLRGCAERYGHRFARTSATPQDVADGAIVECTPQSADLFQLEFTETPHNPAVTFDRHFPDIRRIAIHSLLDARYPAP